MPSCGTTKDPEYYKELKKRRDAYRSKLILKGIASGSTKMMKLMGRKFL